MLADGQELGVLVGLAVEHDHVDDLVALAQAHALDPAGRATHGPDLGLVEADGLAVAAGHDDVAPAVGQLGVDQAVVLGDGRRDQARGPDVGELGQQGPLDVALARGEHDVVVLVDLLLAVGDHLEHLLVVLELEEVDQGLGPLPTGPERELEHALAEHPAGVGEQQDPRVRGRLEQLDDLVVVVAARAGLEPDAAAVLDPVLGRRHPLDVALTGDHQDHRLVGDEVDRLDLELVGDDLGPPRALLLAVLADRAVAAAGTIGVAVLLADLNQLAADDGHELGRVGEDRLELEDQLGQLLVLGLDLLALEAGEPLEPHVEDGLGLALVEAVGALLGLLDLGLGSAAALEEAGEALERLGEQLGLGLVGVGARADQRDDAVDRVDGDAEALDDLAPGHRLVEVEAAAAGDDRAPMVDEVAQALAEVEDLRPAVDDGDHVDPERGLEIAHLVELVEDDLGGRVLLDRDPDPHAGAVGVVLNVGDALDLLVTDELGDALDQAGLVDLVGDLGDDDRLAALVVLLDLAAGSDRDRAAALEVGLLDPGGAEDDAAGREVGPLDVVEQLTDLDRGVVDHRDGRVDQLGEVVRRDVGRHADRDPDRAVEQQVGDLGRQDRRLELFFVVVGDPVDGVLLEVGQELAGELLHPHLRVAHGRRRVPVDRAEVALTVDQRVAHGEVLGEADQRVVDGRVTVGVVLADHVPDHARRLLVGLRVGVLELVHRIENSAMHRLEPVADVGQGSGDDDGHRVVQEGATHLVFDVEGRLRLGHEGLEVGLPARPQA